MTMRTPFRKVLPNAVLACALVLGGTNVFGLGSDHPNGVPVNSTGYWPAGMIELANLTNRVHGYFVNDADVFFFSGDAATFTKFLQDYSKIGGTVNQHRLILHGGAGQAYSPWGTTNQPCDWELSGLGNGWRNGIITNYLLEVHFWTGGKILLDQVVIPKNVEVTRDTNSNAAVATSKPAAAVTKRFCSSRHWCGHYPDPWAIGSPAPSGFRQGPFLIRR